MSDISSRRALDGEVYVILPHGLPASTATRVQASLAALADFPRLGPALEGRWARFRFVLGPWPWMLPVYAWDEDADRVVVVTIQDAGSVRAATSERPRTPG